jgi:trehalose 6-phosphate phosphatase
MSHAMRHLFESWTEIADRLSGSPKIALFLDFDGTLTRIRPRPEDVRLDPDARQSLATLARSPRFRVSVISGRKRSDLRARLRVPGIRYLGLHGWDNGTDTKLSAESRAMLLCAKLRLSAQLMLAPGVWIEDKDQILAVHFRNAGEPARAQASAAVRAAAESYHKHLRVAPGKEVWEIIPRELEDKGAAVRHELAALCCGATPIYAGDDLGDEPAFVALRQGITIYVGRIRRTKARFYLADSLEVHSFLNRLRAGFA